MPEPIHRPEVHVIGNGASNALFDCNGGYRVACNIPTHGIAHNALSIIDLVVVNWMSDNAWNPRVPVLCTGKVKAHAVKRNREGHWFDVYDVKHRYSAGHHAVEHHAPSTDRIHLWGFDSIWTNSYGSQMDSMVPRGTRPNLNAHWIPHWQRIFSDFSSVEFVIHAPSDAKIPELGENARKA